MATYRSSWMQRIEKWRCNDLKKHCNFIVNLKNATAKQIENLGETVKQKVFENSGIRLYWEIERVGDK